MNHSPAFRRMLAPVLALALVCTLSLPASAFFWNKKTDVPSVSDFSKNGMVGQVISFSAGDFPVSGGSGGTALAAITLKTLPDIGTGMLTVGGQPLTEGALVDASALSGLQFQALPTPSVNETAFTFLPSFTTGETGEEVTVTLYLLTEANEAPIARNMDLSTYKNVAITGWFDAEDGEGDSLTFQLTSTPARGAVTVAEDGSSQFVYTPYENKTGKDSFTYVAVDPAGTRLMGAGERPRAPGMKYRHYAPKAPVTVVTGEPERSAAYIAAHAGPGDGVICFEEFLPMYAGGARPVMSLGPAGDKGEQARRVFDALRAFDHTAVSAIWAQCPDSGGIGLAVTNRLNKAAGFHIVEA